MTVQWIIVILIVAAAFAYITFKIIKVFKGKDGKCAGCLYSSECSAKKIKNTGQTRKNKDKHPDSMPKNL
jgi:hypothetical protein